jgi:hypothetical protein
MLHLGVRPMIFSYTFLVNPKHGSVWLVKRKISIGLSIMRRKSHHTHGRNIKCAQCGSLLRLLVYFSLVDQM